MRRNSIAHYITKDLGYCCEWYFFALYDRSYNRRIADRLGVTERAVRLHRAVEHVPCLHRHALRKTT